MKKKICQIEDNAWTRLQDADAEKHILEISCRAENGKVVEVRVRHNDGEEKKGEIKYDGKPVLPLDIAKFAEYYENGKLEIR